jgi:hypothetical protein
MPKMQEQFSAKRKYPKKKPPHAALALRSSGLNGVFRRGVPAPAKNAMHPCIAPVGQIRSNPAVLGAASGGKIAPASVAWMKRSEIRDIQTMKPRF